MIRGSSRISVDPREYPLHPRECPWILANVRGHPRGSFWNPRGCAKCPISDHQSARECAKSIREAVFDIRESSGDIPEGPNDLREDAKLIREDATDVSRGSTHLRGCPGTFANVRGSSRMSGDVRECTLWKLIGSRVDGSRGGAETRRVHGCESPLFAHRRLRASLGLREPCPFGTTV